MRRRSSPRSTRPLAGASVEVAAATPSSNAKSAMLNTSLAGRCLVPS